VSIKVNFRDAIAKKLELHNTNIHSRNASSEIDMNKLKHSYSKPLFKKLEINYNKNYLLPELDRSKEILEK
jgi:hypothetical protein